MEAEAKRQEAWRQVEKKELTEGNMEVSAVMQREAQGGHLPHHNDGGGLHVPCKPGDVRQGAPHVGGVGAVPPGHHGHGGVRGPALLHQAAGDDLQMPQAHEEHQRPPAPGQGSKVLG